jgi:hypothetical protein
VTNESPKPPFKAPTRASEWVLVGASLALSLAFSYFLGEGRGFVCGTSIFAIIFLIQLSWPLRKEVWFWLITGIFAALHAVAAVELNWSWLEQGRNFKLLGTLWTLDVAVMAGIVYTIYRLKYGVPAKSIEDSVDDLPRYGDRDLGL